jgi:hypothetical protein
MEEEIALRFRLFVPDNPIIGCLAKRHSTLRSEKNCLNCGNEVAERYCSHCGQENLVIHDSTWHMIVHYVQDLFHYDGRFMHTMKNLLHKPGQIPLEYIEGKRRNNIEPIKLYVFASTVFFLLFFIVADFEFANPEEDKFDFSQRMINLQREKTFLEGTPDTALVNQLQTNIMRLDTSLTVPADKGDGIQLDLFGNTVSDSLSPAMQWIEKRMEAKLEKLEKEHGGNEMRMLDAFKDEFMHKLPQLLFISMPFFALLLLLMYINRSNRNYVEHFIFSTYHYSYLYLVIAGVILLDRVLRLISASFANSIAGWSITLAIGYICVYLALSMKRFYGGRWFPLLLRYGLLGFLFFWLLFFLIVFMALFTAVT